MVLRQKHSSFIFSCAIQNKHFDISLDCKPTLCRVPIKLNILLQVKSNLMFVSLLLAGDNSSTIFLNVFYVVQNWETIVSNVYNILVVDDSTLSSSQDSVGKNKHKF